MAAFYQQTLQRFVTACMTKLSRNKTKYQPKSICLECSCGNSLNLIVLIDAVKYILCLKQNKTKQINLALRAKEI